MTEALPTSTDGELLRRYVRQQDEQAFAQLVHRHQAMVLGAAGRRTGDLEMARDVAQQVFTLMARKAARLVGQGHDRLAGWLYQTAGFEAAKACQSERRRLARHEKLAVLATSEHSCSEQWRVLEEAMAALAPKDREAIVMHYFQDLSYPEMASLSARSEAAMRKRVSRALAQLGRHLQRGGLPMPAAALLTTAVTMQSTLPAQASLAAPVLAAVGQLPALAWVPWGLFMTTSSALKTAAAIAVLAAVPLAWQTSENSALRQKTSHLQQTLPTEEAVKKAVAPASAGGADALAAAQARLQTLREERGSANARLVALRAEAAKLENEVVVSLGRVDEIAHKMADLQLLAMEVQRLEQNKEEQAKLIPKLMEMTTAMMPVMAEFRRLSQDPQLVARLFATTTAQASGASAAAREEMERRLLRHYQAMKAAGLTLDRRPAENKKGWDRRYGEASAAAMRDIENLLPAAYRESPMWKSQTNPDAGEHLDFLDAFGGPAPEASNPPAPSAP